MWQDHVDLCIDRSYHVCRNISRSVYFLSSKSRKGLTLPLLAAATFRPAISRGGSMDKWLSLAGFAGQVGAPIASGAMTHIMTHIDICVYIYILMMATDRPLIHEAWAAAISMSCSWETMVSFGQSKYQLNLNWWGSNQGVGCLYHLSRSQQ